MYEVSSSTSNGIVVDQMTTFVAAINGWRDFVMSLGFTLFMVYIIHDATDNSEFEKNADKITIEESGDTTTMYHGGSPVYMKVKDSVLLNFIDSTKINWNEVESRKK